MKKVLLIDDDEELCAELAEMLRLEEGVEVETVFDGDTGSQRIRQNAYDVIILDLKLPKLTGYQVLEQAKTSSSSTRPVKILILSGRPLVNSLLVSEMDKNDEEERILKMADAVMNKPFVIEEFLTVVRALIAK
jgi:DNA-binding response OmpR family regulator